MNKKTLTSFLSWLFIYNNNEIQVERYLINLQLYNKPYLHKFNKWSSRAKQKHLFCLDYIFNDWI